jgi:hypothetical protein
MTTPITLREIHDQLAHPRRNDDRVIDDAAWVNALMSMRPHPETLRRGERWAETRSQHLGDGRTLYAVMSRDEDPAVEGTRGGAAPPLRKPGPAVS